MDVFGNYDIPIYRGIQYANDMGLMFLTKHYFRIQKVLPQMWRDNPGGLLALGVLEYSGSVDEIIAIKTSMSPFK